MKIFNSLKTPIIFLALSSIYFSACTRTPDMEMAGATKTPMSNMETNTVTVGGYDFQVKLQHF